MKNKLMPLLLIMIILVLGGVWFAWQGVSMHTQVAIEEDTFHALQDSYFSISKAERDAAATGSELNANLVEIVNYPSSLLFLKLVGIGKILTGIFLVLFAILIALIMMPIRLKEAIRE